MAAARTVASSGRAVGNVTSVPGFCRYAERIMDLNRVTTGRNPPKEINAFVEIPYGGVPVKYELDKNSGALYVDRFLHTAMFYPEPERAVPNWPPYEGNWPLPAAIAPTVNERR